MPGFQSGLFWQYQSFDLPEPEIGPSARWSPCHGLWQWQETWRTLVEEMLVAERRRRDYLVQIAIRFKKARQVRMMVQEKLKEARK